MEIEKIYTYPVKAFRAVELDSVQVTKHGFPHDRRFMVLRVIQNGCDTVTYKNIHVADTPESVFFHPSLDLTGELITITYRPPHGRGKETSIEFPQYPYTGDLEIISISMHKSPVQAFKMSREYNSWLSDCYGFPVVLAYLGPSYRAVLMSSKHGQSAPSPLPIDQNTGLFNRLSSLTRSAASLILSSSAPQPDAQVTFADCAPYLVVSRRSVDDLHARLPGGEEVDILKFRPNIVVSGADAPWDEDYWGQIMILSGGGGQHDGSNGRETRIECIHNCVRCKSINIDYETGKPGEGPTGQLLKKMQRDRRVDLGAKYSPAFGRYSFLHPGSEGHTIRVGDRVVVSNLLSERTKFDWPGLSTR